MTYEAIKETHDFLRKRLREIPYWLSRVNLCFDELYRLKNEFKDERRAVKLNLGREKIHSVSDIALELYPRKNLHAGRNAVLYWINELRLPKNIVGKSMILTEDQANVIRKKLRDNKAKREAQ